MTHDLHHSQLPQIESIWKVCLEREEYIATQFWQSVKFYITLISLLTGASGYVLTTDAGQVPDLRFFFAGTLLAAAGFLGFSGAGIVDRQSVHMDRALTPRRIMEGWLISELEQIGQDTESDFSEWGAQLHTAKNERPRHGASVRRRVHSSLKFIGGLTSLGAAAVYLYAILG